MVLPTYFAGFAFSHYITREQYLGIIETNCSLYIFVSSLLNEININYELFDLVSKSELIHWGLFVFCL